MSMNFENEVILRGVVNKVATFGEKKTAVTISTLNATPKPNFPEVLFLGENAPVGAKLNKGDHITIYCHVQTFKRKQADHVFFIQRLVADKAERTPYVMEKQFGIKDGRFMPAQNIVALQGELLYRKKVTDTLINLIVRVSDEHNTRVKVCYYLPVNKVDKFYDSLYEGAQVYITGCYQTSFKPNAQGQTARYENIVVDMIHVGDKEEKMPSEPADIDVPDADEVECIDSNPISENTDDTADNTVIHIVG